MEEVEKINIQGTMKKLDIDEKLVISKKDRAPSYVRWLATKLKEEKDMYFRVSVKEGNITVTRIQ